MLLFSLKQKLSSDPKLTLKVTILSVSQPFLYIVGGIGIYFKQGIQFHSPDDLCLSIKESLIVARVKFEPESSSSHESSSSQVKFSFFS